MARYDFKTQRLFVSDDLAINQVVETDRGQANYLLNVLRLKRGDRVLLFNGRDGEWLAEIDVSGRRNCTLTPIELTRSQPRPYDLHYLFAPLKQARLDYMIQKAVEMGAGVLQPVQTQHGQVSRVNEERMAANAREAAEQCGILSLPEIRPMVTLGKAIANWAEQNPGRRLIFCDEAADGGGPLDQLAGLKTDRLAILIGPEGGFSDAERDLLSSQSFVTRISLGPRILRADTAAVAALAVLQAAVGDWSGR